MSAMRHAAASRVLRILRGEAGQSLAELALALPILMALRGDATDFLERAARTQWGLMVCVYFISHIPMMMQLPFTQLPLGNAGLVIFLVIVVQGSDVLQYVWGKLAGRHPVAPRLSPGKTWEGLIGGIVCSSALGAALQRRAVAQVGAGLLQVTALGGDGAERDQEACGEGNELLHDALLLDGTVDVVAWIEVSHASSPVPAPAWSCRAWSRAAW